ncbi:MAG: ribonuclease D [Acidobacteria bacterium]|nr:ribonuclease D [Acidobacteriota bacterium]
MQSKEIPFQIKLVKDDKALVSLKEILDETPLIGLDIETAYWWDKTAERVSIIQIGVPSENNVDVWIIDCFSSLDLAPLQQILLNTNILKIIHNASFDVNKLRKLANIIVENVFDTMLAARRAKERSCSLAAMAMRHLGIELDKKHQRSNWATRPLSEEQLEYAAKDVVVALMLYKKVTDSGYSGEYSRQNRFNYHEERPVVTAFEQPVRNLCAPIPANEAASQALIKIVMQFPGRYTPQSLSHCLGRERGGLAGYIVDKAISKEAFIDYKEALTIVSELITKGYLVDRSYRLSVGQVELTKS